MPTSRAARAPRVGVATRVVERADERRVGLRTLNKIPAAGRAPGQLQEFPECCSCSSCSPDGL
eukprot:1863818-Prymnesium_polylepis.1